MKRYLFIATMVAAAATLLPAQWNDGYGRGGGYRGNNNGLQIIRADYGYGGRYVDVTRTLRRYVQGDSLRLRVTNEALGVDPYRGKDKELRVMYVLNGRQMQTHVREYDDLVLGYGYGYGNGSWGNNYPGNRYPGDNGPGWGNNRYGSLRILSARYGDDGRYADVTYRLQSMVRGDSLYMRVDNYSMGGDPHVGEDKKLYVTYEFQGQRREVRVKEGHDLRLPN